MFGITFEKFTKQNVFACSFRADYFELRELFSYQGEEAFSQIITLLTAILVFPQYCAQSFVWYWSSSKSFLNFRNAPIAFPEILRDDGDCRLLF